jgi:predicted Zn-dependent protease
MMKRYVGWGMGLGVLLFFGGTVVGCSVNPATGARELSLIGQNQEIQIGRDADQDISASLGIYDDPELQAWIQALGESMARNSERPSLPWTFRVLDDPVVNAFALPGGYIYFTRGILAHFSSEAELAGVLGHEIGHVTARHGVRQVSRAQLAQLGLGIGAVLLPEFAGVADLAGAGLGLLFLRNSRDAERQADDLGLRYMIGLGYEPREMAATFEMLARASGAEDGARIPGLLSTHPDPLDRRDRLLERIAAEGLSGDRVERESYLRRIEGLPFGENPREGFVEQGLFHHPDLAFRFGIPEGWRTLNQKQGVQLSHPDQDAVILLTLAREASARAARDAFGRGQGITPAGTGAAQVNGLPGAQLEFRATTSSGTPLRGTANFIEHEGRVYQLVGYTPEARWTVREGVIRNTLQSFRVETDPGILARQPLRIALVRTETPLTLEGFQARYPSSVDLATLGTINRLRPGDTVPAGTLLKRVVPGAPR